MGSNKTLINQIVKTLSFEDRQHLKYAHDYGVSKYVRLPNNRFIGVHLNGVRNLIIEDSYNDWSIGTIVC